MTHVRSSALFILLLAACGGGGTSSPHVDAHTSADAPKSIDGPRAIDAQSIDATATSQLVLQVPASYSGAARQLAIVGVKHVPVSGPPDAVFLLDNMPMPHGGQPMTLALDTSTASGQLYVVAVLYQQGGGQYSPKSGVDYVAQSASTFDFTGAAMDLGSMDLVIAP
ncbi:MAG TPA: hypothetical protein VLT45_07085 [Kofleriaceae bacterium]|nr:hypothetical protein [Kofleriaceae bacterium]